MAFGSTLATILLNSDVAFLEGFTVLALLAGLQFIVAWASAHVPGARPAVTSQPLARIVDGELQHSQLRRNRLRESEVLQAVRSAGSGVLSDIAAVVLETNGSISVIPQSKAGNGSALKGVRKIDDPGRP